MQLPGVLLPTPLGTHYQGTCLAYLWDLKTSLSFCNRGKYLFNLGENFSFFKHYSARWTWVSLSLQTVFSSIDLSFQTKVRKYCHQPQPKARNTVPAWVGRETGERNKQLRQPPFPSASKPGDQRSWRGQQLWASLALLREKPLHLQEQHRTFWDNGNTLSALTYGGHGHR